MGNSRDNNYFLKRLEKDGWDDLLLRVASGEITVYRATVLAGYRKRKVSTVGKLQHQWDRASRQDRLQFTLDNHHAILSMIHDIQKRRKSIKSE